MKKDVKVPAVGESITEGTIAEWQKSDGDIVKRDEILFVLETDKASVDVVAEDAGKLTVSVGEGEIVEIGSVVGSIDTSVEASSEDSGAKATSSSTSSAAPQPTGPKATEASSPNAAPDALSPAVRKIVKEKELDPNAITGTGKAGRLTKADVLNATATPQPAMKAASETNGQQTPLPELPQFQSSGAEENVQRVTMSRLRQTIANRLVEAQQTAAILTTFNEIDMSAAMELRKKYKDKFKEKYGLSLGFMGFFVKATCEALKEFPAVNASIDGKDLLYANYVHMGIAVSTEKGLVVPAIRHADKMTVAEIEKAIRHYAVKARDGKISIDDLKGGTFTISNGGVFGSLMSTPILNPPQSGILGLHKIEERPIAVNGQVEIRPMMYVALSYDHRVIDGKESVSFLVRIKELLEDPARILLEI